MHASTRFIACLLGIGIASAAAQAAGVVQVSYLQPDRFTDVGRNSRDVDRNLQQLTRHFERLAARYLVDGQQLRVEVLDVDLAGELRPSRRFGHEIRVLKGMVDWPRITLRFTLDAAGRPALSGERQLADMAYLERRRSYADKGPLDHEYRLLDEWFSAEFGAASYR